jgi:hypothetical protein
MRSPLQGKSRGELADPESIAEKQTEDRLLDGLHRQAIGLTDKLYRLSDPYLC